MDANDTKPLDALAKQVGVLTPITWLESPRGSSPFVFGWRKPTVVIPSSVRKGLTPSQLRCVMLHELAHIRFGDTFWNTALYFFRLTFLYQPHVVRLLGQAKVYREFRCDDFAIQHAGDRIEYAHAIRQLLGKRCHRTCAFELTAASSLVDRIERLLPPRRPQRFPAWSSLASLALIAGGASLLPSVEAASRGWGRYQPFEPTRRVVAVSAAFDRLSRHASELETDGQIILPNDGLLVFEDECQPQEPCAWSIHGLRGRNTIIQVRGISGVQPFVTASWPDSATSFTGDTDSGSGRGSDRLLKIPGHPHLDHVHLIVESKAGGMGRFFIMIRQPHVIQDIDADHLGPESSLLVLDNHEWAQIPSVPNMPPPAIDYPKDIDTFQVWVDRPGRLAITVDGYRGRIHPFIQVFDNDRRPLLDGVFNQRRHICRVVVDGHRAGYFIAVRSCDDRTGAYSLQVHFD